MIRRRSQGFTLIEIMVVITIIAVLASMVVVVVPMMQERGERLECQNNLGNLGKVYMLQAMEKKGKAHRHSGVALWLSYRVPNGEMVIKEGNEKALICPGDPTIVPPVTDEERKRYDSVDLNNPPDDLCSYAARDFKQFPMNKESTKKEIIGCDRQGPDQRTPHHKDGIMIVWSEGDTGLMSREELGIPQGEPIVIGPDSDHEILKKVVYINRKTE